MKKGLDLALCREQVVHLILIMRAHSLHGCRDISAKAYRCSLVMANMFWEKCLSSGMHAADLQAAADARDQTPNHLDWRAHCRCVIAVSLPNAIMLPHKFEF